MNIPTVFRDFDDKGPKGPKCSRELRRNWKGALPRPLNEHLRHLLPKVWTSILPSHGRSLFQRCPPPLHAWGMWGVWGPFLKRLYPLEPGITILPRGVFFYLKHFCTCGFNGHVPTTLARYCTRWGVSSPTPNNQEFYRLPAIAHVSYAWTSETILCNTNYVEPNSKIGEPNKSCCFCGRNEERI